VTPVKALQAWLALEHEAVWLCPVVGARSKTLFDRATASYKAHRDVRDELSARLRSLGARPVAGALSYDVGPLTTPEECRAAVQSLEVRIAAACLTLAGDSEHDLRRYAVTNVRRAALSEQAWGAGPQAFPGLP
jgi:hypothetical protein